MSIYSQINQRTGPTFTTPTASRPRPARRSRSCRTHLRPDLPRDPRQPEQRADDHAELRDSSSRTPGRSSNRLTIQSRASATSRRSSRARSSTISQLKNNWAPRIGATWIRPARPARSLRQLRPLLLARAERSRRSSAVGRRRHQRADYFDANLTQPIPNGVLAGGRRPHFTMPAAVQTRSIRTRTSYLHEYIGGAESIFARTCRRAPGTSIATSAACSKT